MTWFKIDDGLATHPKPRRAGLPAMGLWAVSGAYASQHLTDGFVPDWYVTSWPSGKRHAAALVAAGLWLTATQEGEQGWRFHEWDQCNPTREQELERKREQAKRQAEWRQQRKNSKRHETGETA